MASGTAVIATKAGAWEEILQDRDVGEIVEKEVEAVRQALSSILSDPENLIDLGENGRRIVLKEYSISKETSKLVTYYQKSMAK